MARNEDLASVIDLFVAERLPFERMEMRVTSDPDRAVAIVRPLLGDLRATAAVPALTAFLSAAVPDDPRRAAIEAVGRIGDPSVVPVLLRLPKDGVLVEALATIGGDPVLTAMDGWLRGDVRRHAWAACVLGGMDDQRAVDRLLSLLADPARALHAAFALLLHPHPHAWKDALPIAAGATAEWRATVEGNLGGPSYDRLGSEESARRRANLADIARSSPANMVPTGRNDHWSAAIAGTWSERTDDGAILHVFTHDRQWFVYEDGELDREGTGDEADDGSVRLWDGVTFSLLTEQDGGLVITDPNDATDRVVLERHSAATDVPPDDH